MTRRIRTLAACALTACVGLPAAAQSAQAPIVNVKVVNGDQIEMTARDGSPIIMPRGLPLADNKGNASALKPSVKVDVKPDGYDAVYTFTNATGAPLPLSRLNVGVLTLGDNVTFYDFRRGIDPVKAKWDTYRGQAWFYPMAAYSPVWVMANAKHAVGMSVQYPMLDYQHDVRVGMNKLGGRHLSGKGGKPWSVDFRLSNLGIEAENGRLQYPAEMMPGETRTYTVSVRVTEDPNNWITTLTPYRDYFQQMYGRVKYDRDTRPVQAVTMAVPEFISENNPSGWSFNTSRRPDVFGFGPWSKALRGENGWPRVMLWKPTGQYKNNRQNNFPPQFTSRWMEDPKLATALDPSEGLPAIAASGRQLGLWWGRACQIARQWDDPELENFNPSDAQHRALAFKELDLAVQAGATVIGLDTFFHKMTPVWQQWQWMLDMQERAPGVKFVIEPMSCDVMHVLAPTFMKTWKVEKGMKSFNDGRAVTQPHLLADLLVPGHEIWAWHRYAEMRKFIGAPDKGQVERDAEHFAAIGMVPVIFTDFKLDKQVVASPSWRTSLPQGLRRERDQIGIGKVFAEAQAGDSVPAASAEDDGRQSRLNRRGDRLRALERAKEARASAIDD